MSFKLIKFKLSPDTLSIWSLILLLGFLVINRENAMLKRNSLAIDNHSIQYNALLNSETKAFLDTIAWAETGSAGTEGYKALVFKGKFKSFATHPKIKQCALIKGRHLCSDAEVLNLDIKLHIRLYKSLWQQVKAPVNDRTATTQFEL